MLLVFLNEEYAFWALVELDVMSARWLAEVGSSHSQARW